jgi:hypothetical protein
MVSSFVCVCVCVGVLLLYFSFWLENRTREKGAPATIVLAPVGMLKRKTKQDVC